MISAAPAAFCQCRRRWRKPAPAVMKDRIDLAVSYCMQVDHGFAQPLEFLLGGLDTLPVLPVFINGVAAPAAGFQRTRMLGEAIGRFLTTLNKRVLIFGSGGLSHQPPVPELAKADAHMRDQRWAAANSCRRTSGNCASGSLARRNSLSRTRTCSIRSIPSGTPLYEPAGLGRLTELDAG